MNVNGLSTVSHTTTSGILNSAPHSSSTSHLHHPSVAYDCLWNYSQYSSANPGSNLKDPPLLSQFSGGQYPLNGILGGSRQPSSPSHNTNLRAGSQEFWANGTQSPMGLNFDSQELYDSFPDQNFEMMPNGPPSFFTSPQTSPMLGSSIQTFAPSSQEVGSGIHPDEAAEKELTSVVAENGAGLVGSLELEEEQPGITRVGPRAGLGEGRWGCRGQWLFEVRRTCLPSSLQWRLICMLVISIAKWRVFLWQQHQLGEWECRLFQAHAELLAWRGQGGSPETAPAAALCQERLLLRYRQGLEHRQEAQKPIQFDCGTARLAAEVD